MELTKNELIGLIQYVSGELKEDLIDITEQDAESILDEYLKSINYNSSCDSGVELIKYFLKNKNKQIYSCTTNDY